MIVPGIAGLSVMSTTFSALAMNVTFLREQGVLKRIRGTPLPSGAYLAGVAANAVTNALVQVGIIVSRDACSSASAGREDWLALAVFVAAGVACLAALGVAFAHLIPNFDAAPAYVNVVFLPVIFISGVFYDATGRPAVPARHRPGAAAHARHRRPVRRDGAGDGDRRPSQRPARHRGVGASRARCSRCAGFSWERRRA